MARRYVRDNRGRFAPAGKGATARGGRLRTASGGKRATQTQQIKGSGPSGTIGKPKGLKPGAIKKKSGQTSVDQAKSNYKAAFNKEQEARQAYFKTQFGTPEHTAARAKLDAATAKADNLRNKWRDTKAGQQAPSTPPAGSQAAIKIEQAKGRSEVLTNQRDSLNKQLKDINQKIKDAGPNAGAYRLQKLQIQDRLQSTRRSLAEAKSAARGDTASVNRPMAGSRGKALDREISRNVKAQKQAERAADKERNRAFKAQQSRAKKLRDVHLQELASGYSKRSGRNIGEVKKRIRSMEPKKQIELFRQYVKENRRGARK